MRASGSVPAWNVPAGVDLLVQELLAPPEAPVTIVHLGTGADACLREAARRIPLEGRVRWLRLDEKDNVPRVFAATLGALSREERRAGTSPSGGGDGAGATPEETVAEIVRLALATDAEQWTVVIEGLERVSNPEVVRAFASLVERTPTGLRVVIVSTGRIPIRVARLRVRRMLREVTIE